MKKEHIKWWILWLAIIVIMVGILYVFVYGQPYKLFLFIGYSETTHILYSEYALVTGFVDVTRGVEIFSVPLTFAVMSLLPLVYYTIEENKERVAWLRKKGYIR